MMMKNSGIEWIGKIPEDWNLEKLKYTFVISSGSTPKSDNLEYWGGDIPWVTPADYKTEDKYVYHGRKFLAKAGLNAANLQLIPANSIIFSKRAPIGSVAITGAKLAINQGCISCIPVDECDIRYYYFVLSIFTEQFDLLGSGTTFKEISSNDFRNFIVPVPSVLVQKKLADYLDRKCSQIDAIIARQQEVIEKLKAYKLSVITEAVTKGLNPNVSMKDSWVEWIGKIPEHWDILKLQAHTRMLTPMRDRPEKLDGDIPWVRIEDYAGKYISTSKEGLGVSLETVKEMNLKIYPVGSILCTSSCDLGKCAIVTRELVSNQRFINIIPDSNTNSDYLYYLMLSNAERLNHLSTGTIQANLSRKAFEHLMVQFPPISEQKTIAEHLDKKCEAIELSINKKQELIDRLSSYKKSLIYEVVTGKKMV